MKFVKDSVAKIARLADNKPEPGDLVNEDNYDLKSVAYYMK
jgi:hypothetical protein